VVKSIVGLTRPDYGSVLLFVIKDTVVKTTLNVAYWGVPHELTTDLQRQILQLQIQAGHLRFAGPSPLDRVPVASGSADIAFWLAYVVAITLILFWSVRRKQV
jgi:hypothetical protein